MLVGREVTLGPDHEPGTTRGPLLRRDGLFAEHGGEGGVVPLQEAPPLLVPGRRLPGAEHSAQRVVHRGIGDQAGDLAGSETLRAGGMDLREPGVLTVVSAALSNLVSNVPATMLLIKFVDPSQPVQSYVLALSSTFAGNLITLGSIANLIVIEQAQRFGVKITFRDHARTGVPITLASLAVTAAWIYLAG